MRIAVATCDDRISPVFESSKAILLVDLNAGRESDRKLIAIDDGSPAHRVRWLVDEGVHVLICGGITTSLIDMLNAAGIGVVDRISGRIDEALRAYRTGSGQNLRSIDEA